MAKRWVLLFILALQLLQLNAEFDARHPTQRRATSHRTKVLILGAGVAGLTAAKTLRENGVNDFLILEAQDYIGGRFKQRSFAGARLEEGANWIHYADSEDDPLWKLKEKYNLRGIFTNYSDVIIK